MGFDAGLLPIIQWAVKSGILPAGTAVILVVFCGLVVWLGRKNSADVKNAITAIEKANAETCAAIQGQVTILVDHTKSCEKRYEQLRVDMSVVQDQVGKTHEQIWREVLTHLRGK